MSFTTRRQTERFKPSILRSVLSWCVCSCWTRAEWKLWLHSNFWHFIKSLILAHSECGHFGLFSNFLMCIYLYHLQKVLNLEDMGHASSLTPSIGQGKDSYFRTEPKMWQGKARLTCASWIWMSGKAGEFSGRFEQKKKWWKGPILSYLKFCPQYIHPLLMEMIPCLPSGKPNPFSFSTSPPLSQCVEG